MRKIIEKFFLALASYSVLFLNRNSHENVVFLLTSIILALLIDLNLLSPARISILIGQVFLFFIFPHSLLFFPLFVYTAYQVFGSYSWFSFLALPVLPSPFTMLLSLVAAYLSYQTKKEHDFRAKSVQIQNRLAEDKMSLRRKQQQLEQDQEKNMEIATLSERNRIAHTLHDSIGHLISSSILQLEALQITTEDEKTRDSLELLSEHLQSGMTDIRQTLHQLYNESFDLRQRLEESLEPLENRELTFHYSIESVLPLSVKLDLVTIVKELVTNCCKHSDSSRVRIILVEQPGFYSLTYQDNGSIHSQGQKGIGIYSIEEIVQKYQGNVTIDQENGYSIHLIIRKEAIEG